MKYIFSVFAVLSIVLSGCAGLQGNALKGNIKGAGNLQVVLEQSFFDRTFQAIGKAACDSDGNFTIEQKGDWPEGVFRLTVGAKKVFFMLDGKEKVITLKGDINTIDKFEMEVEGSETYTCFQGIIKDIVQNVKKMSPEIARANVEKGCTPLMRAYLGMQFYGPMAGTYQAELQKLMDDLKAVSPDSRYLKDMEIMKAKFDAQLAQQAASELIKIGQPAPEISLPGPDGKTHALSSLKGKVVLLDFWASWCGPCRKANPHVVEVYNKYKSKGFEVFSVSLDGADPRMKMTAEEMEKRKASGKTAWIGAIEQDKLSWANHVSDLKHWGSAPAAVYGVTSIPKTFLIGRDGNIVALNPRDNLEQELLKVL